MLKFAKTNIIFLRFIFLGLWWVVSAPWDSHNACALTHLNFTIVTIAHAHKPLTSSEAVER